MYAARAMLHRYAPRTAASHGRWFAPQPRHYSYLSRKAGPCGEAMPMRGRGEGRQGQAAEGWQGADAATMTTPPCAVPITAAC